MSQQLSTKHQAKRMEQQQSLIIPKQLQQKQQQKQLQQPKQIEKQQLNASETQIEISNPNISPTTTLPSNEKPSNIEPSQQMQQQFEGIIDLEKELSIQSSNSSSSTNSSAENLNEEQSQCCCAGSGSKLKEDFNTNDQEDDDDDDDDCDSNPFNGDALIINPSEGGVQLSQALATNNNGTTAAGESQQMITQAQQAADLAMLMSTQQLIDMLDKQDYVFPMDSILPCSVAGLTIKKIEWRDFEGTPNYSSRWSAHVFWGINYTYKVRQKTAKNKKVSYVILPDVEVWMRSRSWAKKQVPHLLNHEQGHYLIGCFCGLEFKKQALAYKFTDNYRFEIIRLFESILKEHTRLEKAYDKETNHRLNRDKQQDWDTFMANKINEYKAHFAKLEKVKKPNAK